MRRERVSTSAYRFDYFCFSSRPSHRVSSHPYNYTAIALFARLRSAHLFLASLPPSLPSSRVMPVVRFVIKYGLKRSIFPPSIPLDYRETASFYPFFLPPLIYCGRTPGPLLARRRVTSRVTSIRSYERCYPPPIRFVCFLVEFIHPHVRSYN